ncbi:ABC transporter permease [Methanococcoides alaskense]|uniref:ABC transport system permease protein n=1 Tax=Methanococcoides alaskense TaxID=325778 RepID=A0AA90Z7N1_9EURY|nr:ABC transporter permease [Methanococcoides alaskense]MDA0525541.1 ABC transporter permease [Methanococcoides alaskense]MDR6222321.1 putative ABC transport system permease protein [Methanococcoides alaskense]
MRFKTSLKLATNILLHSKIRSWLTIIGIVIGVASVVSIVALGDAMTESVESSFEDMDLTMITVTPGYSGAQSSMGPPGRGGGTTTTDEDELTDKDIMALRSIEEIEYMYGQISGKADVDYTGETASLSVTGVDPQVWKYTSNMDYDSGRALEPSDNYVAVIGYNVANELFDQPIGVNRVITIEDKSVRVIGILEDGESNNAVIMPIDAAINVIEDAEKDVYGSIVIKVEDEDVVESAVEEIESTLLTSRHVAEKDRDFSVTDSKSQMDGVSDMVSSMTYFLGAIAGVSLLVGAVGIANTMFTSVMEKTKEIGTMKAIGAKNRDIMMIFVMNSALVGFVGGFLGIVLGEIVSRVVIPMSGLQIGRTATSSATGLSPELMVLGIGLAMLIGVISGVIPAYNASKMKPVDALRYE